MQRYSFYELDGEGRIVYARDLVEPALKPGSSALLVRPAPQLDGAGDACASAAVLRPAAAGAQGLKLLAPVVRKLGARANPAVLKEIPWRSVAAWLFYAGATPACVQAVCVGATHSALTCTHAGYIALVMGSRVAPGK